MNLRSQEIVTFFFTQALSRAKEKICTGKENFQCLRVH